MTNTASPEPDSLGTQAQTRAVAPLGAGLPRPGPVGLARPARYRVANTPLIVTIIITWNMNG